MEYKHMIQLKNEFESLGFDMKKIEMEEPFPNRVNLFQLSLTIPINDPKIPGDIFSALITGRIINAEKPVIDQIHAAFLNTAPNGSKQIIVSDSFERVNGMLPTKEQIFENFLNTLRNNNIKEKFRMNEGNLKEPKQNELKKRNRL